MTERIHDFLGAEFPLKTIPGFYAPRPGIRECAYASVPATVLHRRPACCLGDPYSPTPPRATGVDLCRLLCAEIGCSINHDVDDTQLKLMEQLGVDWAHINVNDPALHNVESYLALKKRVAEYGMQVYRIAKHDVHNQPEITLGLPGRDQKIQDLCDFITDIGKAGIHYHT